MASFLSVRPNLSFHVVNTAEDGRVTAIEDIARSHLRINGGFFVFRRDIFEHMRDGEELVREPFQRLVEKHELLAHEYDGFWQAMDTFKDRQRLEELHAGGGARMGSLGRHGAPSQRGVAAPMHGRAARSGLPVATSR